MQIPKYISLATTKHIYRYTQQEAERECARHFTNNAFKPDDVREMQKCLLNELYKDIETFMEKDFFVKFDAELTKLENNTTLSDLKKEIKVLYTLKNDFPYKTGDERQNILNTVARRYINFLLRQIPSQLKKL